MDSKSLSSGSRLKHFFNRSLHPTLGACLGVFWLASAGPAKASVVPEHLSPAGSILAQQLEQTTHQAVEATVDQKQLEQKQLEQKQPPTLRNLLLTVPSRRTAPASAPESAPPEATQTPANAPDNIPNSTTEEEADSETIRLVLKLSERQVYVYRGDAVEVVYPVAIGRPGWETPTGEFSVIHQVVEPGWTNPLTGEIMPPGENNPLGDRWIAFWTDNTNVIGFHGTPNRESVGQAASHGCIRMYNEDVRQLYSMVSVGTPVIVEP